MANSSFQRPVARRPGKATAFGALACSILLVAGGCGTKHPTSMTPPVSSRPAVANPVYGASATLTGPITTGHVINPLSGIPLDLAENGYVEQEYFASGTAHAFTSISMPSDGRWTIKPTTSSTYRTRILVRRPTDNARFNGTVVVEWMNVSEGESAPDWDYLNPELMSGGYAWVGVSAQALGVDGGTPILGGTSSKGLVTEEPARYGTLHHPGDQYSLDMFAQIGEAIRTTDLPILGGAHPERVVAVGESQSAFYLTTFADAIQPLTHAFDGIFIHSRGGTAAALNNAPINPEQGQDVWIRTDLDVPVFMFETQTDLIELGYAGAQQPNTDLIRTWEVAGTSHADAYLVGGAIGLLGCTHPINDGPQHLVVQAAFAAFNAWVDHGTQPPSPPPFKLSRTDPPALALDKLGNVIGGVRTPEVDVPVSTLSGSAPKGVSVLCSLFGSTTPFSASLLLSLYGTRADYVSKFTTSLDQAIAQGYILAADRSGQLAQAEAVAFPS
jgi:Alpha/beta hydrolase domain